METNSTSLLEQYKFKYDDDVRPLQSLTDSELLKIVDLYAISMLQVNKQEVIKVETQGHENPDVSEIYFRITTQHRDEPTEHPRRVFGFAVSFWSEDFDNLRFTPFGKLTYYDKALNNFGITDDFASHWLSINQVFNLFKNELKIWNRSPEHLLETVNINDEWHEVQGINVLDHY